MKILDRDEFLKLPSGCMFCKGHQWHFDNLMVKGESIGLCDWFEMDFLWPDEGTYGDAIDKLDNSLAYGSSFEMDESYSRDGRFDDTNIFMVLEKEDLLSLRGLIDKSLAIYDSR